jgi:hypothetical protein
VPKTTMAVYRCINVYSAAVTGNLTVSVGSKRTKKNSLEVHILAGERTVNGREGVKLVLESVLVLVVKEAEGQPILV